MEDNAEFNAALKAELVEAEGRLGVALPEAYKTAIAVARTAAAHVLVADIFIPPTSLTTLEGNRSLSCYGQLVEPSWVFPRHRQNRYDDADLVPFAWLGQETLYAFAYDPFDFQANEPSVVCLRPRGHTSYEGFRPKEWANFAAWQADLCKLSPWVSPPSSFALMMDEGRPVLLVGTWASTEPAAVLKGAEFAGLPLLVTDRQGINIEVALGWGHAMGGGRMDDDGFRRFVFDEAGKLDLMTRSEDDGTLTCVLEARDSDGSTRELVRRVVEGGTEEVLAIQAPGRVLVVGARAYPATPGSRSRRAVIELGAATLWEALSVLTPLHKSIDGVVELVKAEHHRSGRGNIATVDYRVGATNLRAEFKLLADPKDTRAVCQTKAEARIPVVAELVTLAVFEADTTDDDIAFGGALLDFLEGLVGGDDEQGDEPLPDADFPDDLSGFGWAP